jgi:hypothetical protein
MALEIEVQGASKSKIEADKVSLTPVDGTTQFSITAKATVPGGRSVAAFAWLEGDGDTPATQQGAANDDATSSKATFTFDTVRSADTATSVKIRAVATLDDGSTIESPPIEVASPAPGADEVTGDGNGAESPKTETVVEVEVGEYGPVFAVLIFVFVVALVGAVLWFVSTVIVRISLPDITAFGELDEDQRGFGTWSERVGGIVVLGLAAIGTAILAIGAALGALETRGRLRRSGTAKITINAAEGTFVRGPEEIPSALAEFFKKLPESLAAVGRMRGTLALILAGTVIICASLWAGSAIGDTPAPIPTPTVTVTVTPTSEPSTESSDEPTDEASDEPSDEPAG